MNNIQNVASGAAVGIQHDPTVSFDDDPAAFSTFIRLLVRIGYCGDADWRQFAVGGPVVSDPSNFSILGKRDLPAVSAVRGDRRACVGVRPARDCRGRELDIAEFAADIERPGDGAASRVLAGVVDVHADVPVPANV